MKTLMRWGEMLQVAREHSVPVWMIRGAVRDGVISRCVPEIRRSPNSTPRAYYLTAEVITFCKSPHTTKQEQL